MYDEKAGRIVQLRALNDSKIMIDGQLHTTYSSGEISLSSMDLRAEIGIEIP
ncbi:hypothetical protein [Pseudomonas amygdali]|uniref:Uncharacterized protein n=1 Tax=Pseudomonas amygdali pv. lachrymans TaxID=53707 RepID=A0ABR5KS80_PSEAV|nr:hypothetical protein [Pseudomonas amygdali]KPC17483.1 Uncharacterized protein AC499_0685 [Pseudomonas amygdali pv. lachrymans]RMT05873.1 hypothetical protein ALP54_03926 [Pseudomonas amygdali pv. lachrymans]